jgi:hypothetical protein
MRIRGDTLVALSIPVACAAVLGEACFRTDMDNAETAEDCAYEPTTRLIQEYHARELERNGIVVIPNAICPKTIRNVQHDIQSYRKMNELEKTINDEDVRQDVVAWIGEEEEEEAVGINDSRHPHLFHCVHLIRGIAHSLEQHSYRARRNGSPMETHHKVPRQCQLALYTGNENSGYSRHLDQCDQSIYELGLLEWLRLSDYRSRVITTILYLNEPDRPRSAGGALRCWVAEQDEGSDHKRGNDSDAREWGGFLPPFDISPIGGTLVIFQSDRVEHMVLPSTVDRYALTNWVSGQQV